ncbi:MAG: transketolase, partial [bacterium]|nr:transketolase [bacterium]
ADLSGPTVVKNKNTKEITSENFDGNFIHYGIREHEMSACMNGLSLSGIKPFGSTFFTFFDYLKPALRLSALMKQGVVYVFTHDSFFIGEDGPTHQPIEHLASLRATPNINVIRPADAIEATEAWQIAITENSKPTVLLFSRQSAPLLRDDATTENKVSKGAYIISDFAKGKEKLMTIIATGTEVATAIEVQKLLLEKHNINACVVSMPSMNLFEEQSDEYKSEIIDDETITVSIEAGSTFGWAKYAEINIGLDSFGASAPAKDLQTKFGFTPEQITEKILNEIK